MNTVRYVLFYKALTYIREWREAIPD